MCAKYRLGSYVPIVLRISLRDHIQLQTFCQLFLFPELVDHRVAEVHGSPTLEELLQSPQRRLRGVFLCQHRAMPKGYLPLLRVGALREEGWGFRLECKVNM